MATDYYSTLGLGRSANEQEIQDAYRKLARQYHPDMNPDDDSAKAKFQEVQKAYEVLSDPKKREMYDRYGSEFEAAGGGQGPFRGSPFPGGGPGAAGFEDVDLEQLFERGFGGGAPSGGGGGFADMFRQFTGGRGRGQKAAPKNGANIEHRLSIPFGTSIDGGQSRITVTRPTGKVETIDVVIPAGIRDGEKMRLRGLGGAAQPGGDPGDIIITIKVAPHPCYTREGNNLIVTVPVSLREAVEGAKVDVPTPKGTITMTVPAETSSGKRLRVKGHGVKRNGKSGDLMAEIQIVLPKQVDADLREAAAKLDRFYGNPRENLKW